MKGCTDYLTCFDEPVFQSGTLEIVLPEAVDSGDCRVSASAVVTLTPRRTVSVDLYKAAATLRKYRTLRVSKGIPAVSIYVQNQTRLALMVQQDRFACAVGTCSTFFSVNVTLGSTLLSRCGGSVGFGEGVGLSGACSVYYYCGVTSLDTGEMLPKTLDAFSGIARVSLVDDYTDTSCDDGFRAVLLSNGLLMSHEESITEVRMLHALFYNLTFSDPLKNMSDQFTSLITTRFGSAAAQNATVLEVPFNVTYNYDKLPSVGFFTFDTWQNETQKRLSNQSAVCIVDNFVSDTVDVSCSIKMVGNWLTVKVAQTNFATVGNTITIYLQNKTVVCGGDGLFFGYNGVSGRCSTYFSCFEGLVDSGTTVRVEFSKGVGASNPCFPNAIALLGIETREGVKAITCEGSTPIACATLSKCLPISALCDKVKDCPDGTDEGKCSAWNFVEYNLIPTCPSSLTLRDYALTPQQCIRYAIAGSYTTFTFMSGACSFYNCLDFTNPQVATVTPSNTSAVVSLYIYTTDPSSFKYCTDSLHCNNNGHVLSTESPCKCTCDVQYIGSKCESLRDISLIDELVLVFPPSYLLNATVVEAATVVIAAEISSSSLLSVNSVDFTSRSSTIRMQITDSSGVSSSEVYSLLTTRTSSYITESLSLYNSPYLTATSVVGNIAQVHCRKQNLTNEGYSCTELIDVNQSQTLVLTIPGITFSDASQYIDITLQSNDTRRRTTALRCAPSDFSQTQNPLVTGPCSYVSRCSKQLSGEYLTGITIKLSTNFNPLGQTCNGFNADVSVKVEGLVSLPADASSEPSTVKITRSNVTLIVAIVLIVLGCICGLIMLVWWALQREKELFKFVGPILAALCFFLLFFAVVAYAVYLDTAETAYTHYLVVEEYRDKFCHSSEFSFIPHRMSYVPVDGECHQVRVIGQSEGIVYFAVDGVDDVNHTVTVRRGGTQKTCKDASKFTIRTYQCMDEADIFPEKSELELQFITFVPLTRGVAESRLAVIRNFNPPLGLTSSTTVENLASADRFNTNPNMDTIFADGSKYSKTIPSDMEVRHHVVLNGSDLTADVLANDSNPERVIFRATIKTARTLFTPSKVHTVESRPLHYRGDTSDYTNMGVFFNGYGTSTYATGTEAYLGAYQYLGVESSEFDVGQLDAFTVTFWIQASRVTRGIVYAVADNWQTTAYKSPIVTRLYNIIENTAYEVPWFGDSWNVYSAIYLNGNTQSIHMVWAVPRDGLKELRWDTKFISVQRVFDGNWHFIGIVVKNSDANRREAQLFVDGETSFSAEGWIQCLSKRIPQVQYLSPTSTMPIFNRRDEDVQTGGVAFLGHINAAVYDFAVHSTALIPDRINSLGAKGMDYYGKIARSESMALAGIMLVLALLVLLCSLYELYMHFCGITNETIEETERARRQPASPAAPAKDERRSNSFGQSWCGNRQRKCAIFGSVVAVCRPNNSRGAKHGPVFQRLVVAPGLYGLFRAILWFHCARDLVLLPFDTSAGHSNHPVLLGRDLLLWNLVPCASR